MKSHKNKLLLKKLINSYGFKTQNINNNTIFFTNYTISYDPINNYINIRYFNRCNTSTLPNHNRKTITIYFENIQEIEKKLLKYEILPIQTISAS